MKIFGDQADPMFDAQRIEEKLAEKIWLRVRVLRWDWKPPATDASYCPTIQPAAVGANPCQSAICR